MSDIGRARRLRRIMSPAEIALWQYLRTRPGGFKFRRQHPIDPYTLDFYCREAAVAIEVDGDAHDMGDNPERDRRRDALLAARGIVTLRFIARDVFDALEAVAAHIDTVCASRAPPPRSTRSPSPANAGEDCWAPADLPVPRREAAGARRLARGGGWR